MLDVAYRLVGVPKKTAQRGLQYHKTGFFPTLYTYLQHLPLHIMSPRSVDITETRQTMQHLGDEYLLLMTKSLFSGADHQRGGD